MRRRYHYIYLVAVLLLRSLAGQSPPAAQSAPDYVTLYVLDFDNLHGDERFEWLSQALKDMVLLRLAGERHIRVKDAGAIRPYLEDRQRSLLSGMASNDLLLMGTYHRDDALLQVDLQLLDLESWSALRRGSVQAVYSDIPGLNTALVEKVREMVAALEFFSAIDIDAPPAPEPEETVEPAIPPRAQQYLDMAPAAQKGLAAAIDELEAVLDHAAGFRQSTENDTRQEGNTYYREFSLAGSGMLPEERAKHTRLFENVLARVAENPYAAEIGELKVVVDPYDRNRVFIRIPVQYRVKETLVEDMLYSLPYATTRELGRMRMIRYNRAAFNFDPALLADISRGDYRIVPVVQLVNGDGQLQAVIVDSPDISWERYFPNGRVVAVRQRKFMPMMAITTSGFNVDVRLETADLDVEYEFDVEVGRLTDYARVEVRFFKEDDLLRYLRSL